MRRYTRRGGSAPVRPHFWRGGRRLTMAGPHRGTRFVWQKPMDWITWWGRPRRLAESGGGRWTRC